MFGGEVAQRITTPQHERVVVGLQVRRLDAAGVGGVRDGCPCAADPVGEGNRIDRGRVDGGAVSDAFPGDDIAYTDRLQRTAELRDADLQRVHRIDRQRRLRPQPVDEHRGRDGAPRAEQELSEQCPLSGPRQLHGCAADRNLHRPEQPIAHVVHGVPIPRSTLIVLRG